MEPQKFIKKVHFQLTKNCNLRCSFCGQWGEHGFFSRANGSPLLYDDWIQLALQLNNISPKPQITLWGGEPLICEFFDKLTEELFAMGFKIDLVTNGTLIDSHSDVINRCIEKVYVSIDGLKQVHDSIRGVGVFDKTVSNLSKINKEKIKIMTVATETLDIEAFAEYFSEYTILLQNLIFLTKEEIYSYKKWMKSAFDIEARDVDAWLSEGYVPKIAKLPTNVVFIPHGKTSDFCLAPYQRVHIAWNGNLLYCTDFYDFTVGNVRDSSIDELFNNEKSEKYRQEIKTGNCITCNHCSWRNNFEL